MREIKFRGKKKDSSKWVYGFYVVAAGIPFISAFAIRNPIPVIPETVGQFTGLLDKNGKEIYEGDIIQFQSINVWYQTKIMIKKMECKTQKEFDEWYQTLELPKGVTIETIFDAYDIGQHELTNFYKIIGNIHEEVTNV